MSSRAAPDGRPLPAAAATRDPDASGIAPGEVPEKRFLVETKG